MSLFGLHSVALGVTSLSGAWDYGDARHSSFWFHHFHPVALAITAGIEDEDFDLSDIPEQTDEWFARAVRGKFYRPIKKIVSIRLDKDVLAFYRSQGAGYQTRIDDTLRAAMQAALLAKRKARR